MTLKASIVRRLDLLDACDSDPQLRSIVLAHCKRSPVDWVNDWVLTTDPRRSPSTIPFDLFPLQADFLNWLTDRYEGKEDAIAEKSRDVGFTWLCVAWIIHRWLFYPGFKATVGSRKKALVDRLGDPDCIFEKARFLLQSLPHWMLPQYHDNELKLINRSNGSVLTGEGGDNMGRGGRSSIYFIDEAAFIERADRVDAAISANSDCKIKISTPNGPGNPFYRQRFSGNFEVFTFNWKDDPRKNGWELRDEQGAIVLTGNGWDAPAGALYPWYEKQKKTLDSVILAQEVDLNYMASIEGVCIPHEWVLAAIDLQFKLDLPRPGRPIAGLDVANGGKNSNVMVTRIGPVVTSIDDWKQGNTTQTAYKARDLCTEYQVQRLNYDAIGVGSGIGGTLESCPSLPFELQAIVGGAAPSEIVWSEFGNRLSADLFHNLRAEMWWLVRRRFEKTYEHLNNEATYPLDELISIPNHGSLIGQLSQPLRKFTDAGKTLVESKDDMQKRGLESPDFADALIYSFAHDRSPIWQVSNSAWG